MAKDGSGKRTSNGVGGKEGKSLAGVRQERRKIVNELKRRKKKLEKQGKHDEAKELHKRILRVSNIARSYESGIKRRLKESGLDKRKDAKYLKQDRSIYSKGKLGNTRAGEVGQAKKSGTSRQSGVRKQHMVAHAANVAKKATQDALNGRGNTRSRVTNLMKRGNRYFNIGIKSGTQTAVRTNKKGVNKRTTSNETNLLKGRLASQIRTARRNRNKKK